MATGEWYTHCSAALSKPWPIPSPAYTQGDMHVLPVFLAVIYSRSETTLLLLLHTCCQAPADSSPNFLCYAILDNRRTHTHTHTHCTLVTSFSPGSTRDHPWRGPSQGRTCGPTADVRLQQRLRMCMCQVPSALSHRGMGTVARASSPASDPSSCNCMMHLTPCWKKAWGIGVACRPAT